MLLTLLTLSTSLALGALAPSAEEPPCGKEACGQVPCAMAPAAPDDAQPPVDLALCLDTSGSMSGLIGAAKEKLWAVVNDLATLQPAPRLRVALLTFGNDGHDPENGWVSLAVPFTTDLDRISEVLFAQTTNGGTELVGRVVSVARGQLDWSDPGRGLRLLVVAGNESADQDQVVGAVGAAEGALSGDIVVSAIYCGDAEDEIAPGWRAVALAGGGPFASIDKDHGTLALPTPFDEPMAELSAQLNTTYVPIGSRGQGAWANQIAQDSNSLGVNSNCAADRAVTKAGALYSCEGWDLIDALAAGQGWDEIPLDELPHDWQALTQAQREQRVAELAARRAELSERIQRLDAQRQTWLAAERARLQLDDGQAFDRALRDGLLALARERGFERRPAPAAAATRVVDAGDTGVAGEVAEVATAGALVGPAALAVQVPAQRVR